MSYNSCPNTHAYRRDVEHLVDSFPGQSIDFFGALRARVYDDKVRQGQASCRTVFVCLPISMLYILLFMWVDTPEMGSGARGCGGSAWAIHPLG